MTLIDYLTELESAHKLRVAAVKAEEALTKPIVTDLSQMWRVFEVFLMALPKVSDKPVQDPENRRLFVFICIRLFCPIAFYGKTKITYGVCEEMARVLGVHRTLITHSRRHLVFYYKRYKSFREKVDAVFEDVMKMLDEK